MNGLDNAIEPYEDIQFKDLTLKEADILLKRLENQLEYWQNERQIALERAEGIGAVDYDKERINGGKAPDGMSSIDKIVDVYEPKIKLLKRRIENLMKYIDKEMSILGEEDATTKKIIELRDDMEYIKSHNGHKRPWWQIAQQVYLSERQTQRRYDRYKSRCRTDVSLYMIK